MNNLKKHPSSFRDPSGFVFEYEGKLYRQVNKRYADDYDLLLSSGLYDELLKGGKLIAHQALQQNLTGSNDWYVTLLPEQIQFISYPYEWCFDQLKDAALLTLDILQISLKHGMVLKDATPFNVQFVNGKPIFIDTLSFEKYNDTEPWVAYRQFVECFIVPLVLSSYKSTDFIRQLQLNPDGLSTSFAAKLLPFKSRFRLSLLLHIFLPNNISTRRKNASSARHTSFSKQKMLSIIDNLQSLIRTLKPRRLYSVWNNYYEETILSNDYLQAKSILVTKWLNELQGNIAIDIGTNTGAFAIDASKRYKNVIAVDADELCIDELYKKCKTGRRENILPLWVDITNPTPAIGWANVERAGFISRLNADLVMALAVIHHLVIGSNIRMKQVVDIFKHITNLLLIEFVPEEDPKVAEMLVRRADIFDEYNQQHFETCFSEEFNILRKETVSSSMRVLYLMQKK